MLNQLLRHIDRLVSDEDGNAVTEYAVMLSLIVIAALGAITALGSRMVSVFQWEYASINAVTP